MYSECICFGSFASVHLLESFCPQTLRSDVGAATCTSPGYDLEAEEYVPLPKGDVHKKREVVQDVTLHDLDVANARPQVR